jgi:hypothetical protein
MFRSATADRCLAKRTVVDGLNVVAQMFDLADPGQHDLKVWAMSSKRVSCIRERTCHSLVN